MGEKTNNIFGTLSSAPDNAIVNTIYGYISFILSGFSAKNDENENAITNRLCKTLSFKKPSEYPFYFHHQNIENEKENTSTDFAVFGTYAYAQENDNEDSPSLIKFEAKRLNSSLPAIREKEYVCGQYIGGKCVKNSGGIERFKNGRHGKDVINAGIIGYVQTDSPTHWLAKVNEWIKEQVKSPSDTRLKWMNHDNLIRSTLKGNISEYLSSSSRIFGDTIQVRHFWIDISK
ncbi:hypothetical protein [Ferruginibacter sp. HRS2-29]|uniref:hypothetical protein n=1 Tax=Ferruginibacter sp. HRS2-29 TaxID=2487334 RepID=UPI0020CC2584|nr:hypothetical protein [Ferruginibacter sp. HRS2-29]MCP9752356.1 hypothetical protein [Ferruginibacter sp. HRS2-29]